MSVPMHRAAVVSGVVLFATLADRLRVGWSFLRELSGESGYEHYLAAHAAHMEGKHAAHHPPMTRREFERWRVDRGDTSPGARCC